MLEYTRNCKSVFAVKFNDSYDVVVSNSASDYCVASGLTQEQAEKIAAWFATRLDLASGLLSIRVVDNTLVIGGSDCFVVELSKDYLPSYCAGVLANILGGSVVSN